MMTKYRNGALRCFWLTCAVGLAAASAFSPATSLAASRVVLCEEFTNTG
jgi:hypothetical protein